VDLLLISATHHRLEQLQRTACLPRRSLLSLNGFTLALTPLRERADIADIIEALLRHAHGARGDGSENLSFEQLITPQALARLLSHPWPGNIRQLEQMIRQLCALQCAARPIDVSDCRRNSICRRVRYRWMTRRPALPDDNVQGGTELIIQKALRDHGDNVAAAARALGISRPLSTRC